MVKKKAIKKGIPIQHQKFVDEYLIDFNATKAAIRAGYSEKGAEVQGHRLLRNAKINQALESRAKKIIAKTDTKIAKVLKELSRIAFADVTDVIELRGGTTYVNDSEDMGENVTRAISQIQETTTKEGGSLKIKMHDKVKALNILAKYLGMAKEEVELTMTHEQALEELE